MVAEYGSTKSQSFAVFWHIRFARYTLRVSIFKNVWWKHSILGCDDVNQLLEADQDEFLEIMALVGMISKPLHVRRLQKALLVNFLSIIKTLETNTQTYCKLAYFVLLEFSNMFFQEYKTNLLVFQTMALQKMSTSPSPDTSSKSDASGATVVDSKSPNIDSARNETTSPEKLTDIRQVLNETDEKDSNVRPEKQKNQKI